MYDSTGIGKYKITPYELCDKILVDCYITRKGVVLVINFKCFTH